MVRRLVAAAILFTFACSTPAVAQPLADRVRADAMVYFGWAGASQLGSGYEGSHLKAIVDQSNFRQLVNDFVPRLIDRMQQEPDAAEAATVLRQVLTDVAGPTWRHPTAFYFGGLELRGEDVPPVPRLALISRPGKDAPAMLERVKALLAHVPDDAPVPVRAAQVGDLVVVSVGFDKAETAVAGGQGGSGGALAQDAGYKSALANAHPDALAALYVDAARLFKNVDQAVTTHGGPDAKDKWTRGLNASGLNGVRRIIVTETFEGRDWGTRAFVEAPAPRKGLLTVFDSKPVTDEALNAIPKNSTIAGVIRFDLAKLVGALRTGVAQFDADAGRQVEQGLQQVRGMIGIDIEKDLLAALGDEWAYFSDPTTGGKGFLGFTLVNRVRDPKKAETSLVRLQEVINAVARQQLAEEKVTLAFKETKVDGLTIRYLAVPIVTPAWAIEGGNLYVGLFPQTVAAAAAHVRTKSPSILQNEAFAAARKQLGGERAVNVHFMDLPRTAPDAYPGWLMVSRLVGFADLFGVDSPAIVGPPLKTVLAHLSPAVTVEWSDDKGFYGRTRVPFPGSQILASDPLPGIGSNMLPALLEAMKQMD